MALGFTPEEPAYPRSQRLGRLATVDRAGVPQANPVGFFLDEESGQVLIGGMALAKTLKFRNVAGDPKVAFVVDDIVSTDPWRVHMWVSRDEDPCKRHASSRLPQRPSDDCSLMHPIGGSGEQSSEGIRAELVEDPRRLPCGTLASPRPILDGRKGRGGRAWRSPPSAFAVLRIYYGKVRTHRGRGINHLAAEARQRPSRRMSIDVVHFGLGDHPGGARLANEMPNWHWLRSARRCWRKTWGSSPRWP